MFLSYCFFTLEIFNFSLDLSVMSLVDVRFSKIHLEDYSSKTLQPDSIFKLSLPSGSLSLYFLLRKEVIHPHVPVGIPCYDLTPVIGPAFDGSLLKGYATGFGRCRLPWFDGRCVQGPGTYSPRHADPRLLAIPSS